MRQSESFYKVNDGCTDQNERRFGNLAICVSKVENIIIIGPLDVINMGRVMKKIKDDHYNTILAKEYQQLKIN